MRRAPKMDLLDLQHCIVSISGGSISRRASARVDGIGKAEVQLAPVPIDRPDTADIADGGYGLYSMD